MKMINAWFEESGKSTVVSPYQEEAALQSGCRPERNAGHPPGTAAEGVKELYHVTSGTDN
jgi:hypothetical protein